MMCCFVSLGFPFRSTSPRPLPLPPHPLTTHSLFCPNQPNLTTLTHQHPQTTFLIPCLLIVPFLHLPCLLPLHHFLNSLHHPHLVPLMFPYQIFLLPSLAHPLPLVLMFPPFIPPFLLHILVQHLILWSLGPKLHSTGLLIKLSLPILNLA